MFICMAVSMCVERERDGEGERERERGRKERELSTLPLQKVEDQKQPLE